MPVRTVASAPIVAERGTASNVVVYAASETCGFAVIATVPAPTIRRVELAGASVAEAATTIEIVCETSAPPIRASGAVPVSCQTVITYVPAFCGVNANEPDPADAEAVTVPPATLPVFVPAVTTRFNPPPAITTEVPAMFST